MSTNDATVVNPNGIRKVLANNLSGIFIRFKLKISSWFHYFRKWHFNNYILADELFTKALRSLKSCLSVNKNLCWKLVLSLESPVTFDERFKVTLAQYLFLILIY